MIRAPDLSNTPLTEPFSLSGRVAVVTGAARGLGEQIVRRLAEAGADVVAGDIDVAGVEAAAAEISATSGRRVIGVDLDGPTIDVTDEFIDRRRPESLSSRPD